MLIFFSTKNDQEISLQCASKEVCPRNVSHLIYRYDQDVNLESERYKGLSQEGKHLGRQDEYLLSPQSHSLLLFPNLAKLPTQSNIAAQQYQLNELLCSFLIAQSLAPGSIQLWGMKKDQQFHSSSPQILSKAY